MISKRLGVKGITLLELMVVIGMISVLASVAIPKYAGLLTKSNEGVLKGNLSVLRSALQIYYSDNIGIYPTCAAGPGSTVFQDILVPKYLVKVPSVANGLHPPIADVYCDSNITAGAVHDSQGWYYDGVIPTDAGAGGVWVACDHTDTMGADWTSY